MRLTIYDMGTSKNYNKLIVFTRKGAFHWPGVLTPLFLEFWDTQIGHKLFSGLNIYFRKCLTLLDIYDIIRYNGINQVRLIFL